MKEIWYLLKCPKGDETDYVQKYEKLADPKELQEVVCFEYHRMIRYGIWRGVPSYRAASFYLEPGLWS